MRRKIFTVGLAAVAVVGLSGTAHADATETRFTPTFTGVPGGLCGAVINATKLPQTKPGEFEVKVSVNHFGFACGEFNLAIDWKNLDTGRTSSQIQLVEANGIVEKFRNNVISGSGLAPGAGRVEAFIRTTDSFYPNRVNLPHIAGRATFTVD